MGKHAIIVIKNEKNEYLQYYDKRWNSYLFLNCKMNDKLEKNDILLLLGKGHEDYQIINGCKYHFSDMEVVLKNI